MALAQAEQAVEQVLANPQIDRRVLAQQLEEAAQQYEAQGLDSPYYPLAAQFRALIERLDLANYTPPTIEEQIASHLAQAEQAVEQALANPAINRVALAQQLEREAQGAEAQGPDSPYYALAAQFRVLIERLDLANYTPPSVEEQIAIALAQAEQAVEQVLANPQIDRRVLAQQLEREAQGAEAQGPDSPYYPLAAQFRALIERLDLANYTPPSVEEQIAIALAQAEQAVEQVLANPQIDRRVLAQQLEREAQGAEAQGPDSPYYPLAAQFRVLIERLDLANYTPPSVEEQIASHLAQAEQAVEQALANPAIDRIALAQHLEQNAQQAEAGEDAGSPWLVLAAQFRELAAKLIESEEQEQLNEMLRQAAAQVQVALTQNDCEACAALYEKLTVVADAYAGGGHVLQIHAVFAARLRELAAKLQSSPAG
jgi:hypothetical protein